MVRLFVFCAALLGFAGVALGAFAAHGLKARLALEQLTTLQTAVHYQMLHALALLAVALLALHRPLRSLHWAGGFFLLGTLLFSGSLYLMVLAGWKVGIVTPVGGVSFLIGWGCLAFSALKLAR